MKRGPYTAEGRARRRAAYWQRIASRLAAARVARCRPRQCATLPSVRRVMNLRAGQNTPMLRHHLCADHGAASFLGALLC